MKIIIEEHTITMYETVYLVYANNKKYYISKRIFNMLKQFYFKTPRTHRYEMVEEVSRNRYSYDLSATAQKEFVVQYKVLHTKVQALIKEGFTTEQIKQKINRL